MKSAVLNYLIISLSVITVVSQSEQAKAVTLTQLDKSAFAKINTDWLAHSVLYAQFDKDTKSTIDFQGNFDSDGFTSTGSGSYLGKPVLWNSSATFTSSDTLEGTLSGVRLNNDTNWSIDFSYSWGGSGTGTWSINGSVTDDFGTTNTSGSLGFNVNNQGEFTLNGGLNYNDDNLNINNNITLNPDEGTWQGSSKISSRLRGNLRDLIIEGTGEYGSNGGSISGNIRTAPEPLTIFGTGTALGLGVLFKKRELSKKQKTEAMKA